MGETVKSCREVDTDNDLVNPADLSDVIVAVTVFVDSTRDVESDGVRRVAVFDTDACWLKVNVTEVVVDTELDRRGAEYDGDALRRVSDREPEMSSVPEMVLLAAAAVKVNVAETVDDMSRVGVSSDGVRDEELVCVGKDVLDGEAACVCVTVGGGVVVFVIVMVVDVSLVLVGGCVGVRVGVLVGGSVTVTVSTFVIDGPVALTCHDDVLVNDNNVGVFGGVLVTVAVAVTSSDTVDDALLVTVG